MTRSPYRCSVAAHDAGHDLAGTASTVRGFLLLEAPGAWGSDIRDAGIVPRKVRERLRELEISGVRPLLVRHGGRPHRRDLHLFAAHAGPDEPWLEHTLLEDYEQLLDLDLAGVAAGRRPGLDSHDEPVLAVCTHGRHDACCAERGRPVWEALRRADPENAWQVSHIGGDRFAANVLVLPEGLYYGRMSPADAARLVATHREGRLLLEHFRGRSTYPMPVQFGELELRRVLGEDRLDAITLVEHGRADDTTVAFFARGGARHRVRVRTTHAEADRLTCAATTLSRPLRHELLAID